MRYTGLGLMTYALGLALDTLLSHPNMARYVIFLNPERIFIALLVVAFWFAAVRHLFPSYAREGLPRLPLRIVLIGSIFFGLSVAMLALPQKLFDSNLVVIAVGLDLGVLSYGIASLDAHDEGETLSRDFFRSLGASTFAAILFGGQVILAMAIANLGGAIMLLLLMAVISSAIIIQTLSDPIQTFLDRILLLGRPGLQKERADLRDVASVLPRVDETLEIFDLPDSEFTRLTRRAISHIGDLKRLASSPLTHLPIISERLLLHDRHDSTIERAVELTELLSESIERLKPRHNGNYGISEGWRYYNVLYYPYVRGIKLSNHRLIQSDDHEDLKDVLEWFRVEVPERTLHNWQNAAAEIIAKDLREQIKGITPRKS